MSGVHYGIWLQGRNGPVWFTDAILPGFLPPAALDQMEVAFVNEELELCRLCDVNGARCHVILDDGRKLCPVLFKDVANVQWKVCDVV